MCKPSCSESVQERKVIYGDGKDSRELGVKIKVLAGQADKVQGHTAMLLQEFKWTKYSAVAVQAKLNSHTIVAIVDTGRVGVVISKAALISWGWLKMRKWNLQSR